MADKVINFVGDDQRLAIAAAKRAEAAAAAAAASAAILATTYTLKLDETGNSFQYSTSPARYGYGTHRDLTEIANGKLVGRIVIGLRPSAVATSAKLDIYERLITATGANTTAPGQLAGDVLVGSVNVSWADSGAAVGTNAPVNFTLAQPFVRRDGYTFGFDPRFIDGSGNAIATGVASISGTYTNRTAMFFRTGLPNTWSNSTSFTVAVDAYEADTAIVRDPGFQYEQEQRMELEGAVDAINASLTGWQQPSYTVEQGAYYQTGNGAKVTNANYQALTYTLAAGETQLRFTATINGGTTGVICYNAAGAYIGVKFQGSNGVSVPHVDEIINVPADLVAGTAKIVIDGLAANAIKLEHIAIRTEIAGDVSDLEGEVEDLQRALVNGSSYFNGKTGVWVGTSIPAGFGGYGTPYPAIVATNLGMTIANKSISSSSMRRGIKRLENVLAGDAYGWNGWTWQAAFYCLGGSIAEKTDLIANYVSKYKAYWTGQAGLPATLDAPTQAAILASSYENVFATPYDYVFLDHGHNDVDSRLATEADKIADMVDMTSTGIGATRERGLYLGASMAVLDKIRSVNPRGKVRIIGHYEDARKPWVYKGQIEFQAITSLPLYDGWNRFGLTQQIIVGGPDNGKTMTQSRMSDDLHPNSDTTGLLPIEIGDSQTGWLLSVR